MNFCFVAISTSLLAQTPAPGNYSVEQSGVTAVRGAKMPMRDGVLLSADIYRPDAEGKFPAILIQTPYGNNGPGSNKKPEWFAKRGYAVVLTDMRGRFDSQGEFDPFAAVIYVQFDDFKYILTVFVP